MKPIRSILAALDLAETTPIVLRTANRLAGTADARLHVVHAIELDLHGFPEDAPTFHDLCARQEKALDRAIQEFIGGSGVVASRELLVYAPDRMIVEHARSVHANLIVLGAHRKRRELLGTTADRVLRTAPCPCWVARRALRLPLGRVIVTTDFSTAGRAALDATAPIVASFGRTRSPADALLLHVINPAVDKALMEENERMLEDQAAGWLARNAFSDQVRMRTRMVKSYHPERAILSTLERHPADLLVVGTHGRGAIDRLLLGSVAARVLREARCDVLAVPPPRTRK